MKKSICADSALQANYYSTITVLTSLVFLVGPLSDAHAQELQVNPQISEDQIVAVDYTDDIFSQLKQRRSSLYDAYAFDVLAKTDDGTPDESDALTASALALNVRANSASEIGVDVTKLQQINELKRKNLQELRRKQEVEAEQLRLSLEKDREDKVSNEKTSGKGKSMSAVFTAYTAAADEGSGTGRTASGALVQANHTIACPREYPFGTRVEVDGYGVYTCQDRGGAISGNVFDMYFVSKSEAFAFGRRTIQIKILE